MSSQTCKPTKKRAMKMKQRNKEKMTIDGRRAFIGQVHKTRSMDINELQVDDC